MPERQDVIEVVTDEFGDPISIREMDYGGTELVYRPDDVQSFIDSVENLSRIDAPLVSTSKGDGRAFVHVPE